MASQNPTLSPPPAFDQYQDHYPQPYNQQYVPPPYTGSSIVHPFPPSTPITTYAGDSLINPSNNIQRAKHLANISAICFVIGLLTFVAYVISLAINLHLIRRRSVITRRKGIIFVCITLEFIAWIAVPLFAWMFTSYCEDDGYFVECFVHWTGWPAVVTWYAVAIVFGLPRVAITHIETRRQII